MTREEFQLQFQMCCVHSVENAIKQEFLDVSQKEAPREICERDVLSPFKSRGWTHDRDNGDDPLIQFFTDLGMSLM